MIGSKMGNYSVYLHVNRTNGKRYVGITSQRPASRWKNGAGYKKQKRFYCAILSYGWGGFDHYVLREGLTKAEAEKAEVEYIGAYRSNDPEYGYNIENGGRTHKISDNQKAHLREVNTGKQHSEETKRKMSASHVGMSSAWLTGLKASQQTRAKMSKSRSGKKNPRARAVYQYGLDGRFIRSFDYMDEAKAALGIHSTAHISQCCAGARRAAYGYMWSYERHDAMNPYSRKRRG